MCYPIAIPAHRLTPTVAKALRKVLERHPGTTPVHLWLTSDTERVGLLLAQAVTVGDEFTTAMRQLIGPPGLIGEATQARWIAEQALGAVSLR